MKLIRGRFTILKVSWFAENSAYTEKQGEKGEEKTRETRRRGRNGGTGTLFPNENNVPVPLFDYILLLLKHCIINPIKK